MSDHRLQSLLRSASRWSLLSESARGAFTGMTIVLAAFVAAVVIDTLFALPGVLLLLVDLAILGVMAAALAWTARLAIRNRFDPRRAARLAEQQLGLTDNRLINAVDLSRRPTRGASETLRHSVVDEADYFAGAVAPYQAVNFRPMRRAALLAGAAFATILLGWIAAPRVFGRATARLFDPLGDRPPYTLVNFETEIEPQPVFFGRSATIRVRLSGPDLPDQANVVFLDAAERQSQPMLRSADGLYLLHIERAEQSRDFYIDTPKGRSDLLRFEVAMTPLIESAVASYRFPAYTEWPSTSRPLDARGVQALEGAEVTVTVASNMPLKEGRLELFAEPKKGESEPSQPHATISLKPTPSDSQTVSGAFAVSGDGRYRLSLVGFGGEPGAEVIEGRLRAIPDKPPRVEIASPEPMAAAVEGWKVPVVVQAVDDVAVARIVLYAGVNGWGPSPIELSLQQASRNLAEATHEFDLSALGARSGDVISYYASAYDNRPPDGQFADTPTHVLQVISEQEYLDLARQEYRMEEILAEHDAFAADLDRLRQEREKILDALKPLEDKIAAGEPLAPSDPKQLEDLQEQLQEHHDAANALAEALQRRGEQTPLYDFEQGYNEQLGQVSEQLRQQAGQAASLKEQAASLQRQPSGASQRQEFQDGAEQFAQESQPFDEATQRQMSGTREDLETLQKLDEMLAQAERVQSVIQRQRDLADRLGQFRNQSELSPEDQRRADRMAKEQELLQQELMDAVERLEQSAKACQDSLPKTAGDALKLCEAVGQMQVPSDQGEAAENARQGEGDKAHQKADQAAEKLESLRGQCPNGQGAGQEMSELDQGLQLPSDQLGRSAPQLARGRQLPSLGGKPGGQGQGQHGSQARMSVFGPHLPSGRMSQAMSGRRPDRNANARADGHGSSPGDPAIGPESLTPDARDEAANAAGSLRGAPVGYRDQAEAYFRRLAEER